MTIFDENIFDCNIFDCTDAAVTPAISRGGAPRREPPTPPEDHELLQLTAELLEVKTGCGGCE